MINSKTYLTVLYAEKDAVKALGGKWDPAKKKWYVPAKMDITPFETWQPESGALESSSAASKVGSQTTSAVAGSHVKKPLIDVITHAKDKNFAAYSGAEPPWD